MDSSTDSHTKDLKILEGVFTCGSVGWEEFWCQYGPLIEGKVNSFRLSNEDVEEILQEFAYLVVRDDFRVLRGWDSRRSALRTYLKVIVSNLCINFIRSNFHGYRHKKKNGEEHLHLLADEAKPNPREVIESRQSVGIMQEIFTQLFGSNHVTQEDRFLFQLRMKGYSYRKISTILRVEEATIRKRFQRLKDLLAAEVRKSGISLTEKDLEFLLQVTEEDL